jgi:uncharacterized membrane protein
MFLENEGIAGSITLTVIQVSSMTVGRLLLYFLFLFSLCTLAYPTVS